MATDPVCNMEVDPAKATVKAEYDGKTYYFCSESCHSKFSAAPQKYVQQPAGQAYSQHAHHE